jgi:hypothetical protein
MSYVLDQPITSTTQDVELQAPGSTKLLLQVSNGAVLIAFGQGTPAAVYGPPEPYLPALGALGRRFDAVRIRARAPVSVPAPQVMLTAVPEGEG